MTKLFKFTQIIGLGTALSLLAACGQSPAPEAQAPAAQAPASTEAAPAEAAAPKAKPIKVDHSAAEKAALELFEYQNGEWESAWKMFDATGAQTSTLSGTVKFAPLVDNYTQMMTHEIQKMNVTTVAVRGYNQLEGQIVSLNMGPKGSYWQLRQDPVTGVTTTSPRMNLDGSSTIRRFSRSVVNEDIYVITMEMSLDGGQTWYKRYDQQLTRK